MLKATSVSEHLDLPNWISCGAHTYATEPSVNLTNIGCDIFQAPKDLCVHFGSCRHS